MRVLLVDDDTGVRKAVRLMLEAHDIEVVEASGGHAALRQLAEHHFDLVLCDLYMPDGEGLEFLKAVRERRLGVAVVTMSGGSRLSGMDLLPVARHLGATAVLYKPFDAEELVRSLRQATQQSVECATLAS